MLKSILSLMVGGALVAASAEPAVATDVERAPAAPATSRSARIADSSLARASGRQPRSVLKSCPT